jgi:hypothetical protein
MSCRVRGSFTRRDDRPAASGATAGHDRALLGPAATRRRPVARQSAVAALVVGESAEDAGLDRAAPATLGHRGGVASAEAEPGHGGPTSQIQRISRSTPGKAPSGRVIERSSDDRIPPCGTDLRRARRFPLTRLFRLLATPPAATAGQRWSCRGSPGSRWPRDRPARKAATAAALSGACITPGAVIWARWLLYRLSSSAEPDESAAPSTRWRQSPADADYCCSADAGASSTTAAHRGGATLLPSAQPQRVAPLPRAGFRIAGRMQRSRVSGTGRCW